MREISEHKVNPANDKLVLEAVDEPGAGGANHHYEVYLPGENGQNNRLILDVHFQNGPIAEAGVNGATHEVMLAIVADRLRAFNSGPFRCKENACALTHIEEAMHWLQQRTLARMRRGVEGTNAQ